MVQQMNERSRASVAGADSTVRVNIVGDAEVTDERPPTRPKVRSAAWARLP